MHDDLASTCSTERRLLCWDDLGEFKRWLVNVAKGLAVVPPYCSPEYYIALTERRIQRPSMYVTTLSPHKHDVFCLGLVLLQLATLHNAAVRLEPASLDLPSLITRTRYVSVYT